MRFLPSYGRVVELVQNKRLICPWWVVSAQLKSVRFVVFIGITRPSSKIGLFQLSNSSQELIKLFPVVVGELTH